MRTLTTCPKRLEKKGTCRVILKLLKLEITNLVIKRVKKRKKREEAR
jgi:hypothetical protein